MDLSLLNLSKLSTPRIVQPCITPNSARPLASSTNCINFADSQNINGVESSDGIALIKTHTPIQTPKSETTLQIPFLHSVSSSFFNLNLDVSFETKPSLDSVPKKDFNELFAKKCIMCCQICNFNDDEIQVEEKGQKSEILEDILSHMTRSTISELTAAEYQALYKMFIKNIIRTTPDPPENWYAIVNTDLDAERIEEVSWPHMSLVYDILTALLTSDVFNPTYCQEEVFDIANEILDIFQSPDLREREKLIKLFHAFYKSCNKQRNMLRKKVSNFLFRFNDSPFPIIGINEVATVLVPILSGLKVPLHKDHQKFYQNCILPLHRSAIAIHFHAPLLAVVTTMCRKEPSLVIDTINYLATHWPQTIPTKEILFLTEIENMLPLVKPSTIVEATVSITKIVAKCVNSCDFAVSERAMMMWKNELFVHLVVSYSKLTYPIILPAIFRTANEHWCQSICSLAVIVLRSLKGSDFISFNEIGSHMRQVESERILREMERGHFWKHCALSFGGSDEQKSKIISQIGRIFIGNEIIAQKAVQESPQKPKKSIKNPASPQRDPILSPQKITKRQSLGVRSVMRKVPLSANRQQKRLSDFATGKDAYMYRK